MKHGRMDVIGMDRILNRLEPKVISGTVDESTLETTSSQQHGEAFAVMVAAILYANKAAHFD
jgi:hypothetical protein